MDKRVMYALMGGVAVVGAAVAYTIYASKAETETSDEPTIDDELESLGAPEYEANGMLKFEYFLKIF
jgi:hypothetical protein